MICNKCGKTLPDDSTFCQFCGSKIEIPTAPTEETPSISKEEALAKILAAGVVEGHNAVEANRAAQPQNEADSQFGLVPEKPIYTAGIDEQERYLQSLRTPTGEPIKWSRRGSMSVNGIHGMIDVYDIYLMSGTEYKTIYINMYGARTSTMAPIGFSMVSPIQKTSITNTKSFKHKKDKHIKSEKQVSKKFIIVFTIISVIVVMLAIPLSIYLFHEHDYYTVSINDPTCTDSGSKVLECYICKKTEIKTLSPEHNYDEATCTKPATCLSCGKKDGKALGHTDNYAKCYRCDKILFKTLTYTGTGSKIIKNVSVPNGKFVISGYAVKNYDSVGSFYVDLYYGKGGLAAFWIASLYSNNQTLEKAVLFNGAINGGILEIQADDNISWTITIEAIGN